MDNDGAGGSRRPGDAGERGVPEPGAPAEAAAAPEPGGVQGVPAWQRPKPHAGETSPDGDAKPEPAADGIAQPGTIADAKVWLGAGVGANTTADGEAKATEATAEAGAEANAQTEAKTEAVAKADGKAKSSAKTKASAKPKPGAETKPKAEAKAEVEAKADAKAEAGAEAKVDAEAKAEGKAKARGLALAATTAAKPEERAVGKPSRPALAGAVLVGLVLLAVPLAVATVGGDHKSKKEQPVAFGGERKPGDSGYVPGVTDPKLGPPPSSGTGDGSGGGNGGGGNPSTGPSGGPSGKPGGKASPGAPAQPGGNGTPSSGAPKSGDKANTVSVTALAGPGCSDANGSGYREIGRYSDWHTRTGGSPASGCSGRFTTVPMTGARNKDGANSVLWTFQTGKVQSGNCRLAVYVPDGGIKDVGGAPAYYTVGGASFTVDQTANRGSWVDAGAYPVSGGSLTVQLHDRGIDYDGRSGAHLAAAAMRATCKP